MAYIDIKDKEIHYCDSMAGNGMVALEKLLEYLEEESKDKLKKELNKTEWKLIDHKSRIPQQQNCTDCGVFTIMNCILSCFKLVVCVFLS